jgi:hypothetical protein
MLVFREISNGAGVLLLANNDTPKNTPGPVSLEKQGATESNAWIGRESAQK